MRRRRTDVGDHDGPAISAQRLAQQPGEFAIAVVDEPRIRAPAQSVYAVSQRQKGSVNVSSFLEPFTTVLKEIHSGTYININVYFRVTRNGEQSFQRKIID